MGASEHGEVLRRGEGRMVLKKHSEWLDIPGAVDRQIRGKHKEGTGFSVHGCEKNTVVETGGPTCE